jgi:hypothetical protein
MDFMRSPAPRLKQASKSRIAVAVYTGGWWMRRGVPAVPIGLSVICPNLWDSVEVRALSEGSLTKNLPYPRTLKQKLGSSEDLMPYPGTIVDVCLNLEGFGGDERLGARQTAMT